MLPREVVVRDSENISYVGYDPDSWLMRVAFHSGDIWEYSTVPADVFASVVSANSVGRAFHAKVRDKFKGKKVS